MQCPEEEMDTVGKRMRGSDDQPVDSPCPETLGCDVNCGDNYENYMFSINQCESHIKSDLDWISLKINTRDAKKVKISDRYGC
jgi:hypothetical protein